jgi:hypothetical protein
MKTIERVEEAIEYVKNGAATQYIQAGNKTVRISNHGANPDRADYDTISIVIGESHNSYSQDRNKLIRDWERSNEWHMTLDGGFIEQFESVEQFLEWFEIE